MQNLGIPAEEMKERVENALKLLDIWQYRDRNPFDLSGGQMAACGDRQRAGHAAGCHDP